MPCSICSTIGPVDRANTGRDQYFGPPITSLKRHSIANDDDLWECPECHAFFLWHDDRALTGSGNNDEEVLTRLSPEHSAMLRSIFDGGDLAQTVKLIAGLPDMQRYLVLRHLGRDRQRGRALVPLMLDRVQEQWALGFVGGFTSQADDARFVSAELDRRPASRELDALRASCKKTLCSICGKIPIYPPSPPIEGLVKVGVSEDLDIWDCPECDSMFLWQVKDGKGTLTRHSGPAFRELRMCFRRTGPISEDAQGMLFASDRHLALKIALMYGQTRDPDLVRQFVPRIVTELSRYHVTWLHDFLLDFATDPDDANLVLDAITAQASKSRLLESLAHELWLRVLP